MRCRPVPFKGLSWVTEFDQDIWGLRFLFRYVFTRAPRPMDDKGAHHETT